MKNIKKYKKILFIVIAIYVIYTFIAQQKTLNAYKAEENRYTQQIKQAKQENEDLLTAQGNINSKEYIEKVAREKLNMYLPNEKIYIDITK